MAHSENKTTPTGEDVYAFIAAVPNEQRRRDAQLLAELFAKVTGESPVLWGTSIVGFGSLHYRYESGREGDVPAVSFSPRKAQTVLYLSGALADYEDLLSRLGPHQTGKGCLYLKKVDQVEPAALQQIATRSYRAAGGASVNDVHDLALGMPDVTVDHGQRGNPVYQVGRKSFVFFRNPRPDAVDSQSGEPFEDVIVFWVPSEADKQSLVQDEALPFFTTDHFKGHKSVLLRASRIGELTRQELAELIQDAWLSRASARRSAKWLSAHRIE